MMRLYHAGTCEPAKGSCACFAADAAAAAFSAALSATVFVWII